MSTSKLLFAPCLLFAVILIGWSTSLFSNEPSIRSLENQVSNLRRKLQGYEDMKEQNIRDGIEIIWDQQHLHEVKEQEAELTSNVERLTQCKPARRSVLW